MSRREPSTALDRVVAGAVEAVASRVAAVFPASTAEPATDAGQPDDPPSVASCRESKRERVRELLGANGGRLYQSDVVAATGWSDATVSRTLAEMEQTGDVVRIWARGEKVVCYPTQVPDRRSPEPAD